MTTDREHLDALTEILDGDGRSDGGAPEGRREEPPGEVGEAGGICETGELSEEQHTEVAQHLFVTGVLRFLLGSSKVHLDDQVQLAMAVIHRGEVRRQARRARMHSIYRWSLTAAAVVAIAFVVAMNRDPDSETLSATVGRIAEAIERDVDREFEITLVPNQEGRLAKIPFLGGRLPTGRLFLRGKPMAALHVPLPTGDLWIGTDGKESWAVPPFRMLPVLVFRDQGAMQRMANKWEMAMEWFFLGQHVRQLQKHYEVALTRDSLEPPERIDVTARRRDGVEALMPEYVRLVADRKTGRLIKLIRTWGPDKPRRAPERLIIKLVKEAPKPDSFYRHDDHHDKSRKVEIVNR